MKSFRDDCTDRLTMLFQVLNTPTSTPKAMFKTLIINYYIYCIVSHKPRFNFTIKIISYCEDQ